MAGVFDIELHDCETVEVDDSDDAIEIEEVKTIYNSHACYYVNSPPHLSIYDWQFITF